MFRKLSKSIFPLLICIKSGLLFAQLENVALEQRITSRIDSTIAGELALIQEFVIEATQEEVWQAYTTKEGWENWAVPLAEIDLKINGTIKTNYQTGGAIGDSNTIILHIINYVPNRLLTLQAELTKNFPEFMQADARDLYNVIYFDTVPDNRTKITSYGIGYKNTPKYRSLMKFFIQGNEQTSQQLIKYLEGN